MGASSGKLFSRDRKSWRSPTERVSGSIRKSGEGIRSQISGDVGKLVRHWSLDEVCVEGDGMDSRHRQSK